MQKYRQAVMEMIEIQAQVSQDITDQVFTHFNINEEIFQESYQLAALPENSAKFQQL
jgi:hypothetical protein